MKPRPPRIVRPIEPYKGKPIDAKGWKPRPKWKLTGVRMVDGQFIRFRYLYPTLEAARAAAKKLLRKPDVDKIWINEVDPYQPKG